MARYTEVQRAFSCCHFSFPCSSSSPICSLFFLPRCPHHHVSTPFPLLSVFCTRFIHCLAHLSIVHKAATTTILNARAGHVEESETESEPCPHPRPSIPEQMSNKIASDLHFHHFRRIFAIARGAHKCPPFWFLPTFLLPTTALWMSKMATFACSLGLFQLLTTALSQSRLGLVRKLMGRMG